VIWPNAGFVLSLNEEKAEKNYGLQTRNYRFFFKTNHCQDQIQIPQSVLMSWISKGEAETSSL
jgi:hypothetical protein